MLRTAYLHGAAKTLVILTWIEVIAAIYYCGFLKFIISFGIFLYLFPWIVLEAFHSPPSTPVFCILYLLLILWFTLLWITSTRAWDKNKVSMGIAFLALVSFGIFAVFWLVANATPVVLSQ